jgi:hypothetical protein
MLSLRKMFAIVSLLMVAMLLHPRATQGFSPVPIVNGGSRATGIRSDTKLYFFGPKDDGSPGDYVCLVRTCDDIDTLRHNSCHASSFY